MENENITAVAEGKPSGYKVTKKDLRNANWRWLMSVCTFNYQTQQGASGPEEDLHERRGL